LGAVLAKPSKTIAKIDAVNANGTTTVIHSDGSKSTVIGNAQTSGSVYISDGVIVGSAADLPHSEIWV
jgi:hypothetical protein